jgi:hypothetical protein
MPASIKAALLVTRLSPIKSQGQAGQIAQLLA